VGGGQPPVEVAPAGARAQAHGQTGVAVGQLRVGVQRQRTGVELRPAHEPAAAQGAHGTAHAVAAAARGAARARAQGRRPVDGLLGPRARQGAPGAAAARRLRALRRHAGGGRALWRGGGPAPPRRAPRGARQEPGLHVRVVRPRRQQGPIAVRGW